MATVNCPHCNHEYEPDICEVGQEETQEEQCSKCENFFEIKVTYYPSIEVFDDYK